MAHKILTGAKVSGDLELDAAIVDVNQSAGAAGQLLSSTGDAIEWINNYAPQIMHEVKLGAALSVGTPVYVSSADGTNMIVSAASNTSEATSSKTLGLLVSGGALNDHVFVVTEGLLEGLDTSLATAGDPVWLGPNGTILFGLANKPDSPAHLVFIGIVTRVQQNNGEIFVKVQNGFELDELHDVLITSKANNDIIAYDAATGLWKNKTIPTVLGYTPYDASNPSGYISSYTETDTLQSVTSRGSSTTTGATFGGNVTATSANFSGDITLSYAYPRINFYDTNNDSDYSIINNDGAFSIYDITNNSHRFSIGSNGAATFSSSVTATDLITINGSSSGRVLKLNSKDNIGDNWIGFYHNDGTRQGYLGYGYSAYDIFEIYQEANADILFSTNATERMRITSGGAIQTNTSFNAGLVSINTIDANNYIRLTGYTASAQLGLFRSGDSGVYIGGSSSGFRVYDPSFNTKLQLAQGGQLQLNAYGGGSISGTPTYYLAVDSSGYVIEAAGSGGGASVTNNTNNYVLTATGGSDINGESNLIFDGSTLTVNGLGTFKMDDVTNHVGGISVRSDSASGMLSYSVTSSNHASGWGWQLQNQYANQAGTVYHRFGYGTNSYVNVQGGNFGIGTTSPLAKLDVVGNTYVRSGVFYTDTIYPYSGNQLSLLGGGSNYAYFNGSVQAPIFYDSNDTGYYTDPAGTSRLNVAMPTVIRRADHAQGFLEGSYNNIGDNSTKTNPIYTIGSSYNPTNTLLSDMYGIGYTHPNFFSTSKGSGWGLYVASNGSIKGVFGAEGDALNTWIQGYGEATQSWRAPIFYDSNNTGYYLDPAGTSNLNGLVLSGPLSITGNGTYLGDWGYNTLILQDAGGYAGIAYKYGNNVWLARRNNGSSLQWVHSTDASAQNVGTYTQKMELNPSEWWVSTYPGYKMKITGGDVIDVVNSSGASTLYLNYQGAVGATVNIAASRHIFYNNGVAVFSGSAQSPIFYDSNDTGYYLDANNNGTSLKINGGIVSTAPNGAVLMRHQTSEANAWLFKENAENWGLFWFNAGSQSGQTIGSYTTVGAELFGMNNAVQGFNPNSAWTGTDANTRASWMLSNYSGYFWANDTIYSASNLRAPIFYDSNDTGYYVDPAGYSEMGRIRFQSAINDSSPYGIVGNNYYYPTLELRGYGSEMMIGSQGSDIHINYRLCNAGAGGHTPTNWYWRAGSSTSWSNHEFGRTYSHVDARSPIFYDENDTGFYIDPNGNSRLNGLYLYSNYTHAYPGILQLGHTSYNYNFNNGSWAGSITAGILANCSDQWEFAVHDSGHRVASVFLFDGGGTNRILMGRNIGWDSAYVEAASSFRAPIFYDSNDTTYRLDPNGLSYLNQVMVPYTDKGYIYRVNAGWGAWARTALQYQNDNGTDLSGIGAYGDNGGTVSYYYIGANYASYWGYISGAQMHHVSSMRSPIFYDSDNTGYYVDPNGTTYLYNLQLSGSTYFRPSSWIQFDGGYGLYWPNNYGGHFYPNDGSTYTQFRINGVKNGYDGIYCSNSGVNGMMYDGSGNGGVYRESNGRWFWYHHVGNNCMGIGTSTTNASYAIYTDKGIYAAGNSIFTGEIQTGFIYDYNDTNYYCNPAGSSRFYGYQNDSNSYFARYAYNNLYGGTAKIIAFQYSGIEKGYIQISSTSTFYSTSSDYRLKENVTPLIDGIERLMQLKPSKFNFIGDDKVVDGFLAHEAQEVVPEAVGGVKDGIKEDGTPDYQGIDQSKLVPLLTAALQEAVAKIESLEARISALENI